MVARRHLFLWICVFGLTFAHQAGVCAEESVKIDFLPTNPRVKSEAIGFVDYKISLISAANEEHLEKSFLNIPLGDCPNCQRGISLNCKSAHSIKEVDRSCAEGLANGIGFRLDPSESTSKGTEIRIKNGTKYKLDVANANIRDSIFLTPNKSVEIFLTNGMRRFYKIEFFFKPQTGEKVIPPSAAALEAIPFTIPQKLEMPCKEKSAKFAEVILETDAEQLDVKKPFKLAEIKLNRSITWSAAPADGIGYYFVGFRTAGWLGLRLQCRNCYSS